MNTELQPKLEKSAVNFQTKPRKQKIRKDPNAPFIREKLELPDGHNKLLLHSCCAPCSGEVMEAILASGIEFTIYFYNPNIHPLKEYLIRKEENIRFAKNLVFHLLMLITIVKIGLIVPKEWNGSLREVFAAQCVLICALKKRLNMHINTASLFLLVAWEFLAGKI